MKSDRCGGGVITIINGHVMKRVLFIIGILFADFYMYDSSKTAPSKVLTKSNNKRKHKKEKENK
jgi:hypothetical protein